MRIFRSRLLSIVWLIVTAACGGENRTTPEDSTVRNPEPIDENPTNETVTILATDESGGWLNIDLLTNGDPLSAAQRCVQERDEAEAVACFAFVDLADYSAARPESAGNFAGELCWAARWQRDMTGRESGQAGTLGLSCPSQLDG